MGIRNREAYQKMKKQLVCNNAEMFEEMKASLLGWDCVFCEKKFKDGVDLKLMIDGEIFKIDVCNKCNNIFSDKPDEITEEREKLTKILEEKLKQLK